MSCCVMSASVACKYTAYVQDILVTLALSCVRVTAWSGPLNTGEQIRMGHDSRPGKQMLGTLKCRFLSFTGKRLCELFRRAGNENLQ
jgi:hypothetical protein